MAEKLKLGQLVGVVYKEEVPGHMRVSISEVLGYADIPFVNTVTPGGDVVSQDVSIVKENEIGIQFTIPELNPLLTPVRKETT